MCATTRLVCVCTACVRIVRPPFPSFRHGETITAGAASEYVIATNLDPTRQYVVQFMKVSEPGVDNGQGDDVTLNYATFYGFKTDAGYVASQLPDRDYKFEFLGAGAMTGFASEVTSVSQCTGEPAFQNSNFYHSWARKLCAQWDAEYACFCFCVGAPCGQP